MKLKEYVEFDGVGLSEALVRGELSREEVIDVAIDAITEINPKLNAVVINNFGNARATSTTKIEGPLSGVPFLLKDANVWTKDMPTTFSCRYFQDTKPKSDSEIVRRWRQAGLVVVGKTNTPEFAEDFVCEPTFRGPTLNPWNLDLTVGGSSGGAGSAVASGMVPIAHGTDLGGSIRIPAACCGVYGLKPTTGLSPVDVGASEIAGGFNSDHVLTRSVRDSAAALDATVGHCLGYRYRVESKVDSYLKYLDQPLPVLRVGLCVTTPMGQIVPKRQQLAVEKVAKIFEENGHIVTDYTYPSNLDLDLLFESLWWFDIAHEFDKRIAEIGREPKYNEQEALTRFLRERVAKMSAMDHYKIRSRVHQSSVRLMSSMKKLDLVLTPSLGCDPIPIGSLDSRTEAFDYETWAADSGVFAPFSQVCNVTGQPAASLPVNVFDGELPGAVQLAGHLCHDHLVLQSSSLIEKALGWKDYRPPIWAGFSQGREN
jgi:amidase